MSGSIKVGGHTVFVHTGASGAGTLSVQGQNGNVLLSDDGTAVSLGNNVRLPASGGIKDSSGNNILTESGGNVSVGNVTLDSTVIINAIPSGTKMIFQQTSAPVGWTKDTSIDNKALRITSGTVGSGGNSSFNTVFGLTATDSHTLTTAQMPSHSHSTGNSGNHSHNTNTGGSHGGHSNSINGGGHGGSGWYQGGNTGSLSYNHGGHNHGINGGGDHSHNTNNAGSGQGHSHNIDLRVQYVDVIIATKN